MGTIKPRLDVKEEVEWVCEVIGSAGQGRLNGGPIRPTVSGPKSLGLKRNYVA